ncbi:MULTISPECIES: multiple monosaccharide ABC transporter substrate-binding protein [Microbacterium]|uniref:multiple monosaccharide ABC transporter substrate-binding protein n=1 Tax=Microbacterium TaxID=33882 RepID=UPI0012BA3508|nr:MULTISPECIES: multiple monosaccharide ABC transporter substrate-binding protein [Microbacterium]MTE23885.1 substrate-binding domain-containing protein [Microbacterium sp. ZXX196]NHI16124.1 sugar ABC transporter substrate-binding protein [Microbacterium excoecariae]
MKRTVLRAVGVAGAMALGLGLASCASDGGSEGSGGEAAAEDIRVGVAMPTETSERWIADGDAVESQLEEAGYEVDLQFANDDIPTQQQQIEQMITNGADILIVASIDGTALASQLESAADKGIPIIAYDRLINGTEAVDFYVTFDNYQVGVQQAQSLLRGLGYLDENYEDTGLDEEKIIEVFAGSPDDNNTGFFFGGAMDTLAPYLEDGRLTIGSGQDELDQVATLRWDQATAQKRMEDLLTSTYGGGSGQLDGVLSPYDGISRGIITALQNAGYGDTIEDGLPVVSGQDAEIASVSMIDRGVQYATIFKDTRKLATQAVDAASSYASGEEPEANDTDTYDNGTKVVPSFLLESDIVTADDIQELLIDTDYWTEDEIAAGVAE